MSLRKTVLVFLTVVSVSLTPPTAVPSPTYTPSPSKTSPTGPSATDILRIIGSAGNIRGNPHQQPQPSQQQRRVLTCRDCGTRYYEGQYHRCPQPPSPKPVPKPPVVGNEIPADKPTVDKANPTALKLAKFDQNNINVIQDTIVSPLKDLQMGEIERNMPTEKAISDKINAMNFVPQMKPADKDALKQAIKDGDKKKVDDILGNYGVTGQDVSTLKGLVGAQNLINTYNSGGNVNPSDIKNLLDTLKGGDVPFLGNLTSNVETFGVLNKVGTILDIASTILNGGGTLVGTNIPTGIVAIVTLPGLPFGVVVPLGNGVFGVGTGGRGNVGIFQGTLPQPPIYVGGSVSNVSISEGASVILTNHTDEDMKYQFNGARAVNTLAKNTRMTWGTPPSRRIGLPSGKGGRFTMSDLKSGAYEVVKASDDSWRLEAEETDVTIRATGHPVPFTFFCGSEKFVIEPGKSITLNDPSGGNAVFEVRYARSANKEDVGTCVVGGQMDISVGKDKSSGKLALFPSGTEKVKPPAPKQSVAAASSSITYDDTKISAANVSALPVLPSYDD